MQQSFWTKLPKPCFVLAPMADVTDAAFRRLIARNGKPDIMWTEFVSADGLYHTREVQHLKDEDNPLMQQLLYTEQERPIVAQFFTSKPEMMERAARLAKELGFDGIDINMGCPDKAIEKQGAGAALCRQPQVARSLIQAAKAGTGNTLPISVKIRLGYNKDILEDWLPELLLENPAAVTLHARTRKEMSKVPAHWERVKKAVEIRDSLKSESLIIGNGDVLSIDEAKTKVKETGCNGVMLGKAIFGNPWLFSGRTELPTLKERLDMMLAHTKLFEEVLPHKNFNIMKKHYKAYVNGWEGAKELRNELMGAKNYKEVEKITLNQLFP